jgi:hypothetical protein
MATTDLWPARRRARPESMLIKGHAGEAPFDGSHRRPPDGAAEYPVRAQPRLSRRTLLSGSVASLALPWVLRGARAAPPPLVCDVSDAAWEELAGRIKCGIVVRPNDPRFVRLTQPENLRYYNPPAPSDAPPDSDAPFGVVVPCNDEEVAASILWAQKHGLPMVPRSGGHSYAGCSTVQGLVIHAGGMRKVEYSEADRQLVVEGGALNGDIFNVLKRVNRSIVHGRCDAVGISAYIMGGGIGLAMREYGLGCDQVESVKLVLADGSLKTVSASAPSQEDKDLFWAVCGGGGGNLGFATEWRLRTQTADAADKPADAADKNGFIAFSASWRSPGKEQEIFTRLIRALEKSPDTMGAQVSIFATAPNSSAPNRISLTGQLHGTMDDFQNILCSGLTDPEPNTKAVLRLPYWQAQDFLNIVVVPNRYQETSLFADELTEDFIQTVFGLLRTWPGTVTGARVTFFLMGGRVNKVAPDATAFVHRKSQWLLNPALDWTDCNNHGDILDNLKWQRDMQNALSSCMREGGSYQNFPDPELNNHAKAYWGDNYWRLLAVKRRVDDKLVFTPPRNQGITP